MIVVETSALMAILQGEPEAQACRSIIDEHTELLVAAPNLTEALIVAAGRGLHGEMARLIDDLAPTIVPLTEARAYAASSDYMRWGKGSHAAHLNFGDCFAYALAKDRRQPLLFKGDDFARTDLMAAHP